MKTTQVASALVLALTLATFSNNLAFAEDAAEAAISAQAAGSSNNSALQAAITKAERAKTNYNDYTRRLGLDRYLDKQLDEARKITNGSKAGDAEAMAQVLNEASDVVLSLSGRTMTATAKTAEVSTNTTHETANTDTSAVNTKSRSEVVAQASPRAQNQTSSTQTMGTTITVTVADDKAKSQNSTQTPEKSSQPATAKAKTDDKTAPEVAQTSTEPAAQADNATVSNAANSEVEVPNTGTEEKKAGVVTLIIAGIAVVAATAGISAVILKGKRKI